MRNFQICSTVNFALKYYLTVKYSIKTNRYDMIICLGMLDLKKQEVGQS